MIKFIRKIFPESTDSLLKVNISIWLALDIVLLAVFMGLTIAWIVGKPDKSLIGWVFWDEENNSPNAPLALFIVSNLFALFIWLVLWVYHIIWP